MGETIHISLGSTANAISSHLLNLYGAAATSSPSVDGSSAEREESLCDPLVTHEIANINTDEYSVVNYSSSKNTTQRCLQPRAIFVDTRDNFFAPSQCITQLEGITSWSGEVQYHQVGNIETNEDIVAFRQKSMRLSQDRFAYNVKDVNGSGGNSRHEQWDSEEDEEEEMEEKRRRLEQMEHRNARMRQELKSDLEVFWEDAFYSDGGQQLHQQQLNEHQHEGENTPNTQHHKASDANPTTSERPIYWHQYLTTPLNNKYQLPLPFDSSNNTNSSYSMGYYCASNNLNSNLTAWRHDSMSESLRKLLEGCDQIKGFNLVVDGGSHPSFGVDTTAIMNCTGPKKRCFNSGGMYAGLATSLLEELQEECKSAGRMVVLVDSVPMDAAAITQYDEDGGEKEKESTAVKQFQSRLNTGLTLHGLSSNADVFLPVSIEGAHAALFGERKSSSNNRMLFEGSAALALALEASTLSYRLRSNVSAQRRSNDFGSNRSRLGIQSGFYQGSASSSSSYSGESFASASSLTYHEFLACVRSSSDKRRSILELDAMMHPLSFPAAAFGQGADIMSSNILASLMAAGVVSGGGGGNQDLGFLHQKLIKGTSMEQMQMEQNRNYRSTRNYSSGRQSGPGEWLEDCSNGGLLESLSGHSNFGRRVDHHHFALSSSLRVASTDVKKFTLTNTCGTSEFLRPMMESMGVQYRPEVSSGVVVKDTVVDLTEVGSYWNSIFKRVKLPKTRNAIRSEDQAAAPSAQQIANHTPILSVIGNSTRSYPRLHSISSGFVDSLHSRKNMGYLARDVMSGMAPEKDDCEDALEYCRELVDVYEPPVGSGLISGEDENDMDGAYFDE